MSSVPVTITTDAMTYRAVLDLSLRRNALVIGNIVDDATALPLPHASVRADRPSAFSHVTDGGFFAVSGDVARLFPDLAITAYALTLTFSADRHVTQTTVIPIPIGATFPIAAGTVRLRPQPVRLEGRVTRESNRAAIAGATIALQAPPNALLLRTPLYNAHGLVNVTPLNLLPGAMRSLNRAAPAGALTMELNNVGGIIGGTVLRFGPLLAAEYGVVELTDAPTSTVTLRHALRRSYPELAQVQLINAPPAGAPVALARTADAGDALLVLAAALPAALVEISDAAPLVEVHGVNAVTDADGFFAVDGAAGIAALTLRASAGGFVSLDHDLSIDSSRPVADVSFRLKTP